MDDPESEKTDLRRRLQVLRDELDAGRVTFAPHLMASVRQSIEAVRLRPDGQIDLATVDARVRSMALAVTAMRDRQELKSSISIHDIQQTYFDWLTRNFGDLYERMVKDKVDPELVARSVAAHDVAVASIAKGIPDFIETVREFWVGTSEAAYAHLEDSPQLKAVFGGDLFPSPRANIASTCGIYVDTIVLPDPFLRTAGVMQFWPRETQVMYVVKHAMNVLRYRDLALADVRHPIVVVLPDLHLVDDDEREILHRIAEPDIVAHINTLFGVRLTSMSEVEDFANKLEDAESVLQGLSRPDRLLFDLDWRGTTAEQLARHLRESPDLKAFGPSVGRIVMAKSAGRMSQANDLLIKSQRLRGTPLIEAPTSWQYFRWKLEYDAERSAAESSVEIHATRALLSAAESGAMTWLGNVPTDALIQLRKDDALPELRSLIADGVRDLTAANPSNFQRTTDLVIANMQLAFAEHQQKVDALARRKCALVSRT